MKEGEPTLQQRMEALRTHYRKYNEIDKDLLMNVLESVIVNFVLPEATVGTAGFNVANLTGIATHSDVRLQQALQATAAQVHYLQGFTKLEPREGE